MAVSPAPVGSGMTDAHGDPRALRAIAVHADDVLTALEARERGRRRTVLRVTPPLSGRKRARIHVAGGGGEDPQPADDSEPAVVPEPVRALHVPPRAFVEGVPPFPAVDDTEDELRAAGEYSRERHRERHAEAVAEWRRTAADALVDHVTVATDGGDHEVRVAYLGEPSLPGR